MSNYVYRRGTAMPDSEVRETVSLVNRMAGAYVISTSGFGGLNATQVSNTAIAVFINGTLVRIVASGGTAVYVTGIGTVTTNNQAAYVHTVSEAGTMSCIMSSFFATLGSLAAAWPTIPASQVGLCAIFVSATATAFNGGNTSFADGAYTVTVMNFNGASGIAMFTENLNDVPG